VCWNLNGTWLASCSRDFTVKVWDVRHTKREMTSWQAHQGGKDITALAWHPVHLDLLASGECHTVSALTELQGTQHLLL
jgi:polyadenylation factor subunit 2